jgi:hypothetical protein
VIEYNAGRAGKGDCAMRRKSALAIVLATILLVVAFAC